MNIEHAMTKFVLKVQLEICTPNTPQFIWPICQNRAIIWGIFKSPHHMSIVHAYDHKRAEHHLCSSLSRTWPLFSSDMLMKKQDRAELLNLKFKSAFLKDMKLLPSQWVKVIFEEVFSFSSAGSGMKYAKEQD